MKDQTTLRAGPRTGTATRPRERSQMVGWYNPAQLARTAVSTLISTIFGRHSDYRLLEALSSASTSPIDRSKDDAGELLNELWIDYVADLGDGWNSTYAIASSLAQDRLQVSDPSRQSHDTQRGQLLIFGGDMVYPVANREAYERRLVYPYETAL